MQVVDVRHNFIVKKLVQTLGTKLMLFPQQTHMVEKIVLNEMNPVIGSKFISSTRFETNTFNLIVVQPEINENL